MSKHTKHNEDEKFIVAALSSILNSNFKKNKKGMLGNLMGGFIVVMVGFSMMGPLAQELNNAMYCNGTNSSMVIGDPIGETDSFGGGGSAHFGGYDGTVKHNGFIDAVASTSFIKTNESIINPNCEIIEPGSAKAVVIKLVPMFFILGVLGVAIAMIYSALSSTGLIGGEDGLGV